MLPPVSTVAKSVLALIAASALLAPPQVRAITIADGFTYAGTNGFAASGALAQDYSNYPIFEAVGWFRIDLSDGRAFLSSGTLISSEWVLTAGHSLRSSDEVSSINFVLGGATNAADVSSIVRHPLWAEAPPPLIPGEMAPSQGWDVALFRLAAPVTNSITFPQLYNLVDEAGKVGITLGAGQVGTGTDPWSRQTQPFQVFAHMNLIDRVTAQTNAGFGGGFLVTDFDGANEPQNTLGSGYDSSGLPWLWSPPTNIVTALDPAGTITGADSLMEQLVVDGNIVEGSTAPGDSGGPTFVHDGEGWKLAGVTSWGVNPWDALFNDATNAGYRGLYGDVSYMTRVSQVAPWILSVVPEPSTYALLVMTGAGALLLVRRKR